MQTNQDNIYCSGDENDGSGHPKVYLAIKPAIGEVVCPYCSKKFTMSSNGTK
ncbi:MAG: hypothetical protein DGJ47_000595 [Rickettsiaceae bacterium]